MRWDSGETVRRADAGSTLLAVTVVLTAASITWAGIPRASDAHPFIIFGIVIAGGELLRLRLGVCRIAPVGFTAAIAFLVTAPPAGAGGMRPDGSLDHGIAPTVALVGCATLAGALPHMLSGRPAGLDGCAARIVAIAACSPARLLLGVARAKPSIVEEVDVAVLVTIVATAAALLATTLAAAVAAARLGDPVWVVIRNQVHDERVVIIPTALTAALTALAADAVGSPFVLPVVLVPLLFFHLSLRRFARMRATYDQTVAALAKLTEAAGYTDAGHAERTGRLAVAIGRAMSLPSERLRQLRFAALLHDVGQLSLTDPVAGGATSRLSLSEQRTIAELGAAVIAETAMLEEVATIVLRVPEPYRAPHLSDDPSVPLESRIVKVANTVDELLGDSPGAGRIREATERLRMAMAYEYDPRVVSAVEGLLRGATVAVAAGH